MADLRKWMNLLAESAADAETPQDDWDWDDYDDWDARELDRDLQSLNLPTDPQLYRKYSKDFVYCLVRYMQINWQLMGDFMKHWITEVFDREMPVLADSHTVYRGMKFDSLREMDKESNFLNRKTVQWNRFMSASFDRGVADEFTSNGDYAVEIFLTIRTLAGARGVNTNDPDLRVFLQPAIWSEMEFQDEIILHRGSKFRILAKESKQIRTRQGAGVRWNVEMQQVK